MAVRTNDNGGLDVSMMSPWQLLRRVGGIDMADNPECVRQTQDQS